MKIKNYLPLGLSLFTVILELLPFGAVCLFANPEGEPFRETYSYFDLTPFGYANFAPFLTALLTCIALALSVAVLFTKKRGALTALCAISVIAFVLSLAPMLFGLSYFTPIAAVISASLLSLAAVSLFVRIR